MRPRWENAWGEIAEKLTCMRVDFLGVEPERIGCTDYFIEQFLGSTELTFSNELTDPPEATDDECAFAGAAMVV